MAVQKVVPKVARTVGLKAGQKADQLGRWGYLSADLKAVKWALQAVDLMVVQMAVRRAAHSVYCSAARWAAS